MYSPYEKKIAEHTLLHGYSLISGPDVDGSCIELQESKTFSSLALSPDHF